MKKIKFNIEYPFNNGKHVYVHWYKTNAEYLCQVEPKESDKSFYEIIVLESEDFKWYLELLQNAVMCGGLFEF